MRAPGIPCLTFAVLALCWQFALAKPVTPVPPKDKDATAPKDQPPAQKPLDPSQPVPPAQPAQPAQPGNDLGKPRIGIPDFEQMFPKGVLDPVQEKRIKQQLDQVRKQVDKAMQKAQGAAGQVPPVVQPVRPVQPKLPINRADNRFGANVTQPPEVLIEQLGLPRGQGLVLSDVKPDSAAARAGLKKNDILLELAGKKVSDQPLQFTRTLEEIKAGDKVGATILRGGKQEVINDIVLPETPQRPGVRPPIRPIVPNPPMVPKKPNNQHQMVTRQ